MYLNHKIFTKFEILFTQISKFYKVLKFLEKNELRIIIYHHVQQNQFKIFEKQILFLKKHWNFISPKEFEDHIISKKKLYGKNILLTFDDGLYSNYLIAKKILKKYNIKSIFFVPSDFVKIKKVEKAKSFLIKNILDKNLPDDFEKIKNMNIDNLKNLLKLGHYIGAHSKTHVNLGFIKNNKVLKEEIISSGISLEKLLGIKINHFAFTYGNFKSMSNTSLKIAKSKYKFIYSSMRGNNYLNRPNEIIKRDAIYIEKNNNLISIFLSGISDIKYYFQIKKINKYLEIF